MALKRKETRTELTKPNDWVAAKSGPIKPIGLLDLDGRPAFKIALKVSGGRWFLYLGHIWHGGLSIVDVTYPAEANLVRFIKTAPNTWSSQVTIHGDLLATNLELMH